MQRISFFLIMSMSISLCQSQNETNSDSEINYDVVNAFFSQMTKPIAVEEYTVSIENIQKFRNNYINSKRIYETAVRECNSSKDLEIQRTFCPIAYNYKDFVTSINLKDIEGFESSIVRDSIRLEFPSNKSSYVYRYNKSDSTNVHRDYSRIKIQNVLLNNGRDKALVVFSKKNSLAPPEIFYIAFVLEKGIWWRRVSAWPL